MKKFLLMTSFAVSCLAGQAHAESLKGLWAATTAGSECSDPAIDIKGRMAFLEVSRYGFFYGSNDQCQFSNMLPPDGVGISGYLECRGQQGAYEDFYALVVNDGGETMTFQQGVGSARFIQTMQRCEEKSPG